MGRSNSGASEATEIAQSSVLGGLRERLVERLVVTALVRALHPGEGEQPLALDLARLAHGHPDSLDRAIARIVRGEHGRPTRLTAAAADALRAARAVPASATGVVGAVPGDERGSG